MSLNHTEIPGVLIFEPKLFEDSRGYFFESYSEKLFKEKGVDVRFVQDNQSSSAYGVIRGLHYQLPPYAQTKLVRVLHGKILDVIVDLRDGSPTYGKTLSIELSAENKKQIFVPGGFAHGFSVLSEEAEIFYKCDNFYHKDSEAGILYNDPALHIDWQIPAKNVIVSEKDQNLPVFAGSKKGFVFEK